MKHIKFRKKTIFLIGLITCIAISSNMSIFLANNLVTSNSIQILKIASSNDYKLEMNITRDWNFFDEDGSAIVLDDSGNIYITGQVYDFSDYSAFIAKYDKTGNLIWNETWGGSDYDSSIDIVLDDFGNIYITGDTENSSGNYNAFIAKYDSNGHLIWNETWVGMDEETSYGIALDSLGNIYIAGYLLSNYNAFIAKFDDDGDLVDELIWEGSHNFIVTDIALDNTGNIYITGSNNTDDYNHDAFVAKFDDKLDHVSNISWDGGLNDAAYAITLDDMENIYITGETYIGGATNSDAFIVKFNNTGDLIFQSTMGRQWKDAAWDIVLDDLENIYITGKIESSVPSEQDLFIAKFGNDGFLQWSQLWEGSPKEIGQGITLDSSGSIYVTGAINYLYSLNTALIVKYSLIIPPESPGNPPYGLLDLLTSLIGWLVIIIAIGIGIVSGLVIGKKRWDVDAIKKQNNKIVNLKKKQERIEKKKVRLDEKQEKIENQLKGYQKRLK